MKKAKPESPQGVGGEIKPCPFCGEQPRVEVYDAIGGDDYARLLCYNASCHAVVAVNGAKSEKEAIDLWNKRAEIQTGEYVLVSKLVEWCECSHGDADHAYNLLEYAKSESITLPIGGRK